MIHGNHIKADHILFRFVPTQLVCDEKKKKKKSDGLGEWSECDRMRGEKIKKDGAKRGYFHCRERLPVSKERASPLDKTESEDDLW